MKMCEFESELLKLTSVEAITYGKRFMDKDFILSEIFVHIAPRNCHLENGPDCMEKQLEHFQKLRKKVIFDAPFRNGTTAK